jgi:hypothetical protein
MGNILGPGLGGPPLLLRAWRLARPFEPPRRWTRWKGEVEEVESVRASPTGTNVGPAGMAGVWAVGYWLIAGSVGGQSPPHGLDGAGWGGIP